jgi:hypothetical protein
VALRPVVPGPVAEKAAVPVAVPVSARERAPLAAAREEWVSLGAAWEWVPRVAAREWVPLAAVPLLKRPEPRNCWRSCRLRNR